MSTTEKERERLEQDNDAPDMWHIALAGANVTLCGIPLPENATRVQDSGASAECVVCCELNKRYV